MLDRLRISFSSRPIKIRSLISLRKTIEAAEVAAVGYRNSKIAKCAPKRIPQTARLTHESLLGTGLGDGGVGFGSGAFSKGTDFGSDAGRSTFGTAGGVVAFPLSAGEGGKAGLVSDAPPLASGFSTEDSVFVLSCC